MSPNDGRYHVSPATDGRTVVWQAHGSDGVDILARPLAGGPVKVLWHGRAAGGSVDGRVTILDAGRATLEIADPNHAAFIDEVEVGRRVAGHMRVAFEVDDSVATTSKLAAAGAQVIAEPTRTPWNSLNSRLEAPGDLQLTLFTELGDQAEDGRDA
ncbi:VOC family protein [Streptomyces phaeochromogenes]